MNARAHPMLDLALAYAAKGYRVFPCGQDKRPLTPHGFKDASADPDTIRAWWRQHPHAMVGLPTGDGLAVVDLDVDKGTGEAIGESTADALGWGDVLAAGLTVRTPSGGRHVYFAGNVPTKARTFGPGVDTRGAGGYVIAAGSINGRGTYEADGPSILDTAPPPLPETIRAALAPRRDDADRAGFGFDRGAMPEDDDADRVLDLLREAHNDLGRDDWVQLALALKGTIGEAARADFVAFSDRYAGEVTSGEAERVWRSAKPNGRLGLGTVVYLLGGWPREGRAPGGYAGEKRDRRDKSPGAQRTRDLGPTSDGWPEPDRSLLSPDRAEPPAFPGTAVFGEVWAGWIAEAAEAKGAPPDYVAAALLAAVGARIGNARWSAPWKGWAEPPVLWFMAIGNPSSGKTPALAAVTDPLRDLQARENKAHARAHAEWQEGAAIAKIALSAWEAKAKKALANDEPVPDKPDEADPGDEPVVPRLYVNDATIEKMADILGHQPRGLLLSRDELAGMLANLTRYANGGSDAPFWLEAFNGKGFSVERKTAAPVWVERLAIGILGGIQPDRLHELLLKAVEDGMLARFLPVFPDPVPPRRPRSDPDDLFVEQALRDLSRLDMVASEDGPRPFYLPFSEAARCRLDAFRETVAAMETNESPFMVSFIGKTKGFAVRLSLVLAFLDWTTDTTRPEPREIEAEHFDRAAAFVLDYAVPMARRAYAEAATPREERGARALARLIVEKGWSQFTTSDVMGAKRQGLRKKDEIDPALDRLVQAGVVMAKPPERTGGRPRLVYLVNPKLRQAASGGQAGEKRGERDKRPSDPASFPSFPSFPGSSGETPLSRPGDAPLPDDGPPPAAPLDAYADDLDRGEPENGPCEDRVMALHPDDFDPELWR